MYKEFSFYLYLLKTSIRSAVHKRGAFITEASLMIANNMIFFALWWIFFGHFKEIDGWDYDDVRILLAIGCGAYGVMQICCGNLKRLSKAIINGDLDPLLVQPKSPLLHFIGSESRAKGWGNLATTALICATGGIDHFSQLFLVAFGVITGASIFIAMNLIAQCSVFWISSMDSLASRYGDALFLFALYPTHIYSGFLQLIMFTVIPAGLIGYFPVELVRSFSIYKLLGLGSIAGALLYFAHAIFFRGLKKYESGNRFSIR